MLSPLAAIWPSLSSISSFQAEPLAPLAAEKSKCAPVSLGVAFFVCGWVLQFELNQGNLGGSVIGKARLLTSYLDSLHHPNEEQNKQEDEEGGPTWYSLWHQFYFGFRLMSSYSFTKNIRAIAQCSACIIQNHAECLTYLPETRFLFQNSVECDHS